MESKACEDPRSVDAWWRSFRRCSFVGHVPEDVLRMAKTAFYGGFAAMQMAARNAADLPGTAGPFVLLQMEEEVRSFFTECEDDDE